MLNKTNMPLCYTDEVSPEEDDNTVSSASLCMSPTSVCDQTAGEPVCASTPIVHKPLTNGHDVVDNKQTCVNNNDVVNGNVNGKRAVFIILL